MARHRPPVRSKVTLPMAGPAYRDLGAAISAVMDEAEPKVTTIALAEQLRARGWKVDQSLVSKWRNGHKEPVSIRIYPDIDDICGMPRGRVLRRAGYVGDDPADVTAAIMADPHLSAIAKQILVDTYKSAVRRSAAAATA